ncbi:hypothetical protein E2C01_068602 [Portunus trituberculatus]|uniref:Uncharacterized protein n=1 Tax=Portunus trituberculatus TaxID=210409 RepID=A0A5B7HZW5_PORTR|nr:hypothetical protein [Portunus trituberculatus]
MVHGGGVGCGLVPLISPPVLVVASSVSPSLDVLSQALETSKPLSPPTQSMKGMTIIPIREEIITSEEMAVRVCQVDPGRCCRSKDKGNMANMKLKSKAGLSTLRQKAVDVCLLVNGRGEGHVTLGPFLN